MLRKSIGIGLLVCSAQGYANVQVTTTDDVVKDDGVCSLREAVSFVTSYLNDPTKKTSGGNGCGSSDASTLNQVIELQPDKTYTLNSEIVIQQSIILQTQNTTLLQDASTGVHNATIFAGGAHRLFTIDDGRADISQKTVTFNQLNLQGCGTGTCAAQGGLIFNRESLTLQTSTLSNGSATLGGAIYNAGLVTGNNTSSAGVLTITGSIIRGNSADTGAAIFTEQPLYQISRSIIRDNVTRQAGGAVIYSLNRFDDATTSTSGFNRISYLVNSTLFGNSGYLANVRDGVYLNNVTAVKNTAGLYFDAPMGKAHLSNSILVDNGTDCQFAAGDQSLFYNNLVTRADATGCGPGQANNPNTDWSSLPRNKLIAGTAVESASCDLPPADGLLCPFNTPKDQFLGYFRPRLLSSYTSLTQSPMINRGRLFSDNTSLGLYSCESTDQRGLNRGNAVQCDLGAIELLVSPANIARVGQDLTYGQVASINISDDLADGQLLPAAECKAVLGAERDPAGQPWKDGCLRIEQSGATPVSKGTATLSASGILTYTPNGNWHGLDEFNLRVVTTASRFSEALSERDIVIPVRIVQAPSDTFASSTVNVKGGSFGAAGVLGLIALAWYRRRKF